MNEYANGVQSQRNEPNVVSRCDFPHERGLFPSEVLGHSNGKLSENKEPNNVNVPEHLR